MKFPDNQSNKSSDTNSEEDSSEDEQQNIINIMSRARMLLHLQLFFHCLDLLLKLLWGVWDAYPPRLYAN
ncbi:zinc finger MYM-type protein 1-like [Aphis craccivora]|uniref:Zinc finger MYM-type protein 1-like n=1 Tax=Aphis craccivora TaxID=307492 RepID=A0A6G0WCD0_APHCR|nr:zinc finger MYM-type protein 1-like [Aphis craccivora]